MDIASLAISMSQADLATKVATSITRMVMDDSKQVSSQMTEMISQVTDPNVGINIDFKA